MVVDTTSNEFLGTQLLMADFEEEDIVSGAVDHKNRPAIRSKHGHWGSAAYIIGVEVAEKIAYFGIAGNLINFLTGTLGQSTAAAAASLNAWTGVSLLLPILGAVIADCFLGKYYTIIAASILYILGLGLLTLSATLPAVCSKSNEMGVNLVTGCSSDMQKMLFFAALYLVALGQGGHKPCVQAFGADQFDGEDPGESKAKNSFFNWWYFGLAWGVLLGIGVLSYVQDNFSWGLGFGIPCIIMVIALGIFLFGTSTYRFIQQGKGPSPFLRIGRVFVLAARNWRSTSFLIEDIPDTKTVQSNSESPRFQDTKTVQSNYDSPRFTDTKTVQSNYESPRFTDTKTVQSNYDSPRFRLLDRILIEPDISMAKAACGESEVEEAKALLRLFPIWVTSLAFAVASSQISTFFTKQGVTLDRTVGSSLVIPAAWLHSVACICIVIFIPMYDRVFTPCARLVTGNPAGISTLQRIGTGFFLLIICMVVAAVIEHKRLQTVVQYGLIDLPNVTVPMSIWWLLPQFVLFGLADAFTVVGLQEFFYDQVPNELRSVGLALYLSIFGTGNLLSSILVSFINKTTSGDGTKTSWFSDNSNRAHFDYFYWLLAGLNTVCLALFIYFASSFKYNKNKVSL